VEVEDLAALPGLAATGEHRQKREGAGKPKQAKLEASHGGPPIEELTASGSYNPFEGARKRFRTLDPTETRTAIWACGLAAATAAAAAALVTAGYGLPSIWYLVVLAVIAGVAERQSVTLTGDREKGIELAVSVVPYVFTAVAFGPLAALVVGLLGNLSDLRRPYLKWAVYTPGRGLTGAAAGLAASAVHAETDLSLVAILTAALVAALAHLLVDVALSMGTLAVRASGSPIAYPRTILAPFIVSTALYVPIVAFLVYGHQRYSFAVVATFLVPVLALQRVAQLYQQQRQTTAELLKANSRLEHANMSFATALVATLDARDEYTAGHSTAVAIYSRDIAAKLGLSVEQQQNAHLAGLVHDIGKIGLPAGLLEKAGPLTLEERRIMQTHSEIGERILSKVDDYAAIAEIVRHHHERIDGEGYPDGRAGDEIPLTARIIAVADAYNAMTSDRPYREAMSSPVARLRLAQAVGTQFDVSVVAAFEAILATADEAYKMGRRSDFGLQMPSVEPIPFAAIA
jgi:putative nucleotidyltransferase with HDIG domain